MLKSYKYRIHPTKSQETILNGMLNECGWLYNRILETRNISFEQNGISLGLYETQNMIPAWKVERPSLKKVHSLTLQNVNIRVDLAFKAFFRRVKLGETPGYPRFKGQGRYDSMTFPQYGNGVMLVGNKLNLSKLGSVKVQLHRDLAGTPKTVSIRRGSTGKWFVTIACEIESTPLPAEQKVVGVDVGLATFATLSNGEKISNPRFFRNEAKELAKAQRKLEKETNGTPQRKKRKKVIARIHERIANKRTDFAHKVSRTLVDNYGVIVFEDLNIKGMMGKRTQVFGNKLNKSIADVAWSQLAQFTSYKAEEAGRMFLQVDPRNTSKRCSRCTMLVDKDLSVRIHNCPHCGLVLDRDHNAAINILTLGLQRVNAGSPVVVKAPAFTHGE